MAAYRRVDGLKSHLLLTACTLESALGPTLGNEYGRTLPFSIVEQEACFRQNLCVYLFLRQHNNF